MHQEGTVAPGYYATNVNLELFHVHTYLSCLWCPGSPLPSSRVQGWIGRVKQSHSYVAATVTIVGTYGVTIVGISGHLLNNAKGYTGTVKTNDAVYWNPRADTSTSI